MCRGPTVSSYWPKTTLYYTSSWKFTQRIVSINPKILTLSLLFSFLTSTTHQVKLDYQRNMGLMPLTIERSTYWTSKTSNERDWKNEWQIPASQFHSSFVLKWQKTVFSIISNYIISPRIIYINTFKFIQMLFKKPCHSRNGCSYVIYVAAWQPTIRSVQLKTN